MHHVKQLRKRLNILQEQQSTLGIHTLQENYSSFNSSSLVIQQLARCTMVEPFKQEDGMEYE